MFMIISSEICVFMMGLSQNMLFRLRLSRMLKFRQSVCMPEIIPLNFHLMDLKLGTVSSSVQYLLKMIHSEKI